MDAAETYAAQRWAHLMPEMPNRVVVGKGFPSGEASASWWE
jgi:hypothetical protein